jgi:FkbM family methyltransferase
MGMTDNIKRLSKLVREKLNEYEFDRNLKKIQADPDFNAKENIFRFKYKGNQIQIKVPDISDHISYEICTQRKFFSHENLDDLKQFIRPSSVIIDAGANIGNHSLYFASICKAQKIFAFEPQADIFQILTENIRLNNFQHVIIPVKKALGDQSGHASIDFREDLDLTGSRKILNTGGVFIKEDQQGEFELTTLDDYISDKIDRLDFIKIDVQGFEQKLLRGAKKTILKFKPLIYVEITTLHELNELILPVMNEFGYKLKKAYTIDYLFESYL